MTNNKDGSGLRHEDIGRYWVKLDLHDRKNSIMRVRWINALRRVVGKRIPKNAAGAALTSDVDLLLATDEEHLEVIQELIEKFAQGLVLEPLEDKFESKDHDNDDETYSSCIVYP